MCGWIVVWEGLSDVWVDSGVGTEHEMVVWYRQ